MSGAEASVQLEPAAAPGSTALLVVFSSVGAERFTFFKRTAEVPCDRLFIRDPYLHSWFQQGITGGGLDEIKEIIRRHRQPGGELFCMGSSMGGYAALYFGAELGARRVLAISPQIRLWRRLPRSPKGGCEIQAPDIGDLVSDATQTEFYISFGANDLVDWYHVSRLRLPQPHITVHAIEEFAHVVAPAIDTSIGLGRICTDLVTHQPIGYGSLTTTLLQAEPDPRAVAARGFIPQYFQREYDKAAATMLQYLYSHRKWALGHSWLGRAASLSSDFTGLARAAHETACKLAPADPDIRYEAAAYFASIDEITPALRQLNVTLKLRPAHRMALRLRKQLKDSALAARNATQ